MKRFLLSSVFLLAMGRMAFGYINTGIVQVPQMDPQLVSIDDPNFVNKGVFSVDMTLVQGLLSGSTFLYTTSDTLNYTNSGVMIAIPGFDLENFPASVGQAQWSANFVNTNNGSGGGVIAVTNIFGNLALFGIGGIIPIGTIGFGTPGLAVCKVRATNILDSGLITMDATGLIDVMGGDLNLNRGRFVMTGGNTFSNLNFGITYLDYGSGVTNQLTQWDPFFQLTATTAQSTEYPSSVTGNFEEMDLTNATVYTAATPVGTNLIIWDSIYLQDFSPTNVTKNVYFNAAINFGGGFLFGSEQTIEWVGTYRDPLSGVFKTNYFYLSDNPVIRRSTNTFFATPPNDFQFLESPVQLVNTAPAAPAFFNPAPPAFFTNDFSYVSVRPTAALIDTNSVFGGSPTNLLGRIQLTATRSMNLANTHIVGPNYLKLDSRNQFIGNSNALIEAPYSDLYLGVTNGSLSLSNLLVSRLPTWTGVPGAPSAVSQTAIFGFNIGPVEMGGIQAWSASYIFLDANGVTNDVRVLLVNGALQPTTPALQQDLILHATNDLTISDEFNVFRNFSSDATILTVTTNNNSAFSLSGQINLLSTSIFWSASLPNLQFLTNWGVISSKNLMNFAGNMFSPTSDPANATPYQAFVNHGTVFNNGTLIRANYFENNGLIQEDVANGSIDIGVFGTAWATNGSFIAPVGEISIAANSLLASNGVIKAGQDLTLNISPCYLSDGYAFENQFGHITNSVLPNVVTNGNIWVVGGGVRITVKPPTGDLLGTTITNFAGNGGESINLWPGDDRGPSPGGFATNLALGRMILNADANPSQFTFRTVNGGNALYVDSIELQGNTTNTDLHGNPQSIAIDSGMTIYYAQAIENGVSIAEKLNGKYGAASAGPFFTNGGRFLWVSNYAGVYSSTNIPYPDGNTYIFNDALALSPDIDSDGDGTVNVNDATPISIGSVFDITNIGPQPCDGSVTNGSPGDTNGVVGPTTTPLGRLLFPSQSSSGSSGAVSFALAQGSYNGLFFDTNGVNPASSGFFTANVTSKGGLTAKLQLGTHTYSFSKPPFDTSGHFSGQVIGKNLPTLTVNLQLVNNDEITGTVSGNGWIATLYAERAAFSSKNKAPWAGNDTLLLSTKTNSTADTGDSFASVAISSSGAVQWSGMLPDGSKVSQKSALSKDGVWPLYAAPYSGKGVFIGWMQCTNNPDITGSGVWVAPAGANGLCPTGLTNELDATGSSVTGFLNPSIKAILSGASLDSTLTNRVTIFGKTGQGSSALKLSINPKTGVFSGSMADPNNSNQTLSLQGAFLEESTSGGGGFFLSADKKRGGKISLAPAH